MTLKSFLTQLRAATAISAAISERQKPMKSDFDALGLSREYAAYFKG